jgi:hypothetical protein
MERMKRRPSAVNSIDRLSKSTSRTAGMTSKAAMLIDKTETLFLTGIPKYSRVLILKIITRVNPKIPSKTNERIEFRYPIPERNESGKTRRTTIPTIAKTLASISARPRLRSEYMSEIYIQQLT